MPGRCDSPQWYFAKFFDLPNIVSSLSNYLGQSCGNNNLKCASGQCTSRACEFPFLDFGVHSLISVPVQCQTVGASMGLKDACPSRGDTSCQLSCQDPTKVNQCVALTSLLIDGSPCGILRSFTGFIFSNHGHHIAQDMGELVFLVNVNRQASWIQRRYLPSRSPASSVLMDRTWHRRGIPRIFKFLYPLRLLSVLLPFSSYGPSPDVRFCIFPACKMLPNYGVLKAIARCCRGRGKPVISTIPGPTFLKSQHERLESIDRHGEYVTGVPPRTPSFLQTK